MLIVATVFQILDPCSLVYLRFSVMPSYTSCGVTDGCEVVRGLASHTCNEIAVSVMREALQR
jgi:hypothetical protein